MIPENIHTHTTDGFLKLQWQAGSKSWKSKVMLNSGHVFPSLTGDYLFTLGR